VHLFFFFWCGIHTAGIPSAAETHTGGGTVLVKPCLSTGVPFVLTLFIASLVFFVGC